MKGKKFLIGTLGLCMLACAGVGGAKRSPASAEALQKNASELMTVSSGLNVEYNVSGVEKNATLTKDTRKGIHFSSKEKGNAAEGQSVAFTNVLSGLFETDFRVYTENKNTASDWWDGGEWYTRNNAEELRELAITLTDEDENESFTLYIKGGSPWNSRSVNARVAYGDVGENYGSGQWFVAGDGLDYDDVTGVRENGLANAEYNTALRGVSFTNNFLHSTVVGFDPITKEVYGYTFKSSDSESDYATLMKKRVILDLDNPEHLAFAGDGAGALLNCSFANYTVKYTLTDVTGADETGSQGEDERANFILYSLNGQSFAGEDGLLTETVPAGLTVAMEKTATVGAGFVLPKPTLKTAFGESPEFTGNVKVLTPTGRTLLSERAYKVGYSFTPSEEGTYKVIYSGVKDSLGNVRKAFAADGTYSGAEWTYAYPVVAKKATATTGLARELLSASGLNVEYDVSGVEKNADLTRDTQKGIYFSTVQKGEEAEGSFVQFKKELVGNMELNFRVFTDKKNESNPFLGGDWALNNDAEELKEIAITVTDSKTGEKFTVYIKGGTSWSANAPNARVAYGDVGEYYGSGYWYETGTTNNSFYGGVGNKGLKSGEYNTELRGTTFTNASRVTDTDFKTGYTTNIGFDPQTKEVYGYVYGSGAYACHKRVILDLDEAEDLIYATKPSQNGAPKDVVPDAFKDSTFEKYTVKITVTDVADVEEKLDANGETVKVGEAKRAKFIVYHLNGQSLAGKSGKLTSNSGYGAYVAETPKAFVNLNMTLPKPTTASSVLDGEKEFDGTIKIVDENGNVVLAEQPYSEDVVFTPTKTGKYFALYGGMKDKGGNLRGTFTRSGYSAEQGYTKVPFEVKEPIELPEISYALRNTPVWIGAKKAQDDLIVFLTVKKDGQVYRNVNELEIDENFSYPFADDGSYELIYLVRSSSGAETELTANIEIIGMQAALTRPDTFAVYGQDFVFTGKDFKLYHGEYGVVTDFTFLADVFDGEEWVQVSVENGKVNFKETFLSLGEGEWTLRFTLAKGQDELVLFRTVTVLDKTPPVLQADPLSDRFIAVEGGNGEYFVVQEGATGLIPNATATDDKDGAVSVEISLKKPSDTQGVPVLAGTEILFDEEGQYTIVYKATDGAGNYSTIAYFIDVKNEWLSVSAGDTSLELGKTFTPNRPIVVDEFKKQTTEEYTSSVHVFLNGAEVESANGVFTPTSVGEYTVLYVVEKNGTSYSCSVRLTVSDTQKPTVIVEGEYEARAKVGDTIEILFAYVDDQSSCDLQVSVILDGATRIEVSEDGAFKIEKGGRYVIKYTATDLSGNSAAVEYIIDVPREKEKPSSSGSSCSSSAGLGTYVLASMAIVGLAVLKTVRKKENEK